MVRGIVIDAALGIAAGGIDGPLPPVIPGSRAAGLLFHRSQNMKKLVDAGHGQIVTYAVQFNESRPYKARLRRNIMIRPLLTLSSLPAIPARIRKYG